MHTDLSQVLAIDAMIVTGLVIGDKEVLQYQDVLITTGYYPMLSVLNCYS